MGPLLFIIDINGLDYNITSDNIKIVDEKMDDWLDEASMPRHGGENKTTSMSSSSWTNAASEVYAKTTQFLLTPPAEMIKGTVWALTV